MNGKNYFEVFDELFQESIRSDLNPHKEKIQSWFEFAKRKIISMETKIQQDFEFQQNMKGISVTKFKNLGSLANITEQQKELLQGNYEIKLNDSVPYPTKICKVASEPVAYQLYKKRHFYKLNKPQVLAEDLYKE
jgi:hypothetical protein